MVRSIRLHQLSEHLKGCQHLLGFIWFLCWIISVIMKIWHGGGWLAWLGIFVLASYSLAGGIRENLKTSRITSLFDLVAFPLWISAGILTMYASGEIVAWIGLSMLGTGLLIALIRARLEDRSDKYVSAATGF